MRLFASTFFLSMPFASLAIMSLAGCAEHPPQSSAIKLPPPGPRRVEFENLQSRTPATDVSGAASVQGFQSKIQDAIATPEGSMRIERLVARFPDAALDLLRSAPPTANEQLKRDSLVAVAVAYDRLFVTPGSSGWAATVAQSIANPAPYEITAASRRRILDFTQQGRPEWAIRDAVTLPQSVSPFVQAEWLRARGLASLLCDRPTDALHDWQAAMQLAQADVNVRCELHLLAAEALRHDDKSAQGAAAWQEASFLATSIHDPGLWERIIESRPTTASWPPAVAVKFPSMMNSFKPAKLDGKSVSNPENVEAFVWRHIGEWRLSRNESPAALLAFKRADGLFSSPREKSDARIAQARALLTMKLTGPALSVLTPITNDPDPIINHRALAVLAASRITADDVPGALELFRRAVADDDSFPPSNRASARADMGLACLMSNHEEEGLQWLHKAQSDFEREGNTAELIQCLNNEATYLKGQGRIDEAEMIRRRVLSAEKVRGS